MLATQAGYAKGYHQREERSSLEVPNQVLLSVQSNGIDLWVVTSSFGMNKVMFICCSLNSFAGKMWANRLPSLVQGYSVEARHTDTAGEHRSRSLKDVGQPLDSNPHSKGSCLFFLLSAMYMYSRLRNNLSPKTLC